MSYESELDVRVKTYLGGRLIEEGRSDYPEDGKVKLIEGGNLSRVTSGQMLRLLANDRHLQTLLRESGLEHQKIVPTGIQIADLRNRVFHLRSKPPDIQLARDLILLSEGGLRALAPKLA